MPQEILRQNSWTGGELDPRLIGRRDLKAYPKGAAKLENLMPTAQGPIVRRPGLAYVDRVRGALAAMTIVSEDVAPSAPNGGDISSVLNPEEATALVTTTDMGVVDPYVVLALDFGDPVTIAAVDLVGYAAVPLGTEGDSTVNPAPPTYPWRPPGFIGTVIP